MARRKASDPDRPYRWADTPFDPLDPPRDRSRRGHRSSTALIVAALAILGVTVVVVAGVLWSRARGSDREAAELSSPDYSLGGGQSIGEVEDLLGPPKPVGTTQQAGDLLLTITAADARLVGTPDQPSTLVTIQVRTTNTGASTQLYGSLVWALEYPAGMPNPPNPATVDGGLPLSGTLAPGSTADGKVVFTLDGVATGTATARYFTGAGSGDNATIRWAIPLG